METTHRILARLESLETIYVCCRQRGCMTQDPMPRPWLPVIKDTVVYFPENMLLCFIIPSNKLGYVKDSDK